MLKSNLSTIFFVDKFGFTNNFVDICSTKLFVTLLSK